MASTLETSIEEVLFVFGCPRSGTTLVQSILSLHPSVAGTDYETGFFTLQDIFHQSRRFFDLSAVEISEARKQSANKAEFFGRLVALTKERDGRDCLVEKTPQHIRKYPYLKRCFPNAKFLHVLRDPRDAYCSARRSGFIPASRSPRSFARYWRSCVKRIHHEDDDYVMTLRYESFVANPQLQLNHVLQHFGLAHNTELLDSEKRRQHKRAKHAAFQFLDKEISERSVGRWRDELSQSEKVAIVEIAGGEMQRWGYPEH